MKHEWWSKSRAWFLNSSLSGGKSGQFGSQVKIQSCQNLLKTQVNKTLMHRMKGRGVCTFLEKHDIIKQDWGASEVERCPNGILWPAELRHQCKQRCIVSCIKIIRNRLGSREKDGTEIIREKNDFWVTREKNQHFVNW